MKGGDVVEVPADWDYDGIGIKKGEQGTVVDANGSLGLVYIRMR